MGKGNVRMEIEGKTQVITEVFYIPDLKNNLLSIGQLQEKNLSILILHGCCRIYHNVRGLIMQSMMSSNRMFVLLASVSTNVPGPTCFKASSDESTDQWHARFGHLSIKGLRTLPYRKMVKGLPVLKNSSTLCTDCVAGKQHQDPFPKMSAWRASRPLQLVYSDICGPITLESNSHKSFCNSNGISRQLTVAFSPQQNGVAERRNRTLMNMVRCVLSAREVPKEYWP
ncbi:putative RNA-directed DNA polymerase [Dioscorea sansibarensis]